MEAPADFSLDPSRSPPRVVLSGDWTALGLGHAPQRLSRSLGRAKAASLDLQGVGRLDTVGALVLLRSAEEVEVVGGGEEVRRTMRSAAEAAARRPAKRPRRVAPAYSLLIRAGRGVEEVGLDLVSTVAFLGRLLESLWAILVSPRRFRSTAAVALMERAGVDALPIVAVTNFFIGATVAFLGASLLAQFGAQVFTVELIGVAVLREFGVVITAVLLAGRSASSFAAEIGAMKMNQEVDAMQVMGVDPFQALVIPRFIALLLMTPLLTFTADMAGLVGGMMVTWLSLGLSPSFFLQRLLENVGAVQLFIGLGKSPVMAVVVAAIGCRQGLEVGGDVEQLGRRVTTAVVQAIFSIIILDAVFALLFMELGY